MKHDISIMTLDDT